MEMGRFIVTLLSFVFSLSIGETVQGLKPCYYPAMYNFGDSNSDTGGKSAAFHQISTPNGVSLPGEPTGRECDGLLVVDFIAANLGLPFLHPYLNSIRPEFRHGANFAAGGATIRQPNETIFQSWVSPFFLGAQLWQFEQFKVRTSELYVQANSPRERAHLPDPDDFSKALYTIDIGQNDLTLGFQKMSEEQVRVSIPDMLDKLSFAVQKLCQLGARTLWIHNTGPVGCLPSALFYFSGGSDKLDKNGCIKSRNDIAMEFNRQLKERVTQWTKQYPDAALVYVDVYTAKYKLISDANNLGFNGPMEICCGYHKEHHHVWCGQTEIVNGTEIYGDFCSEPTKYISWDGVHYSQSANRWIADYILNGLRVADPPIALGQTCYKS